MNRRRVQPSPVVVSESPEDQATILIVDDVPENLAILGTILQDQYRVRAANSGTRALTAAASSPRPDLILLDVMMPGMDGYSVITQLQKDPSTRDIPVIFVTAMDTAEDEERGLGLGAVDYITKPIKPAVVLARVRTHIELSRVRNWLRHQNGFLEAEVAKRIKESQLIQDIGIHALANLADTRDNETGGHIRRTQAYVDTLARQLSVQPKFAPHLTRPQIALIVKAAPLHDIGKVGIPDQILLKEQPLTFEEFDVMKRHCALGADAIDNAMRVALGADEYDAMQILAEPDSRASPALDEGPLAFLRVAKEIARWHHEKWDGSGYPDGLAGESIPVPARLMALADIFDALTRRRVYKESLSIDEATDVIRQSRGTHLDPDVVDAFIEAHDDFAAIARRYADTELSLESASLAEPGWNHGGD